MSVAWGFLSTARINDFLLAGARRSDRVEVVAVASRERTRAEAYARAKGIERAHATYEALLEDPDVEAVYISLPNSLHVEWSIRALEAGKHVLCEKPLTGRVEEAERAFEAAEQADRLLMEAFMYRHHPQTERLRALILDGAVGELRTIFSVLAYDLLADSELSRDVRLSRELEGGALMDLGCYPVSISRFLCGTEPERVQGTQVLGPTGVDMTFVGMMQFPCGTIATFDSSFSMPDRQNILIVGSEGMLRAKSAFHPERVLEVELERDGKVEPIQVDENDPYRLELENMSDAIRAKAQPLLDRDDAIGQARVINALYRAANEGRAVEP
jgi:predicted dehydrogenase